MHQIGKLAKLRRDIGEVEIVVREDELSKTMKREERIIGMQGSVKHAEREVCWKLSWLLESIQTSEDIPAGYDEKNGEMKNFSVTGKFLQLPKLCLFCCNRFLPRCKNRSLQ